MSLVNCRGLKRLREADKLRVASELGISLPRLAEWLDRGDSRFLKSRYDSSTGKKRLFDVPKWSNRKLFDRTNKFFQKIRAHHANAHGGIAKKSSVTSARRHVGNGLVWTTDIKDCFPSVNREMFGNELRNIRLPEIQVDFFTRLFLCRNRIPQGCPTSNVALNIFFWHLDFRMTEYCGKRNLAYTRMADDIVISGRDEAHGAKATEKLHRMIGEAGLSVNAAKWEKCGFQNSTSETLVHSLNVAKGNLELAPEQKDKAAWVAEKTLSVCRSLQFCSIKPAIKYRNQLHGWYHYSRQTQDPITAELRKVIHEVDAAVRERLLRERLSVKGWKWWTYPHCIDLVSVWNDRLDKVAVKQIQQEFEFTRHDLSHKGTLSRQSQSANNSPSFAGERNSSIESR